MQVGHCPRCGYDLRGRDVPGKCPECGRDFQATHELVARPFPTTFSVVTLFGWPLLFFAATFGIFFASPDNSYAILSWILACFLVGVVLTINGMIVTTVLLKRYVPRQFADATQGNSGFHKRLGRLGVHAIVFFYLMVVLPSVACGGCVILMCSGGLLA